MALYENGGANAVLMHILAYFRVSIFGSKPVGMLVLVRETGPYTFRIGKLVFILKIFVRGEDAVDLLLTEVI